MGIFGQPTPGYSNSTYQLQVPLLSGEAFSNLTSGIYDEEQTITLSANDPNGIIYYTIDGSKPLLNSNIYTDPILINSNTIIRTRTIEPNKLPGKFLHLHI